MTISTRKVLLWSPRILGILFALFLGVFALDVFEEGRTTAGILVALVMHLLPSIVLLLAVAFAWRWEWVGGAVFLACAALYTLWAYRHPAWILAITVPLVVVGALFLLAWRHRAELHAGA